MNSLINVILCKVAITDAYFVDVRGGGIYENYKFWVGYEEGENAQIIINLCMSMIEINVSRGLLVLKPARLQLQYIVRQTCFCQMN
jgi:hypothetical protein